MPPMVDATTAVSQNRLPSPNWKKLWREPLIRPVNAADGNLGQRPEHNRQDARGESTKLAEAVRRVM